MIAQFAAVCVAVAALYFAWYLGRSSVQLPNSIPSSYTSVPESKSGLPMKELDISCALVNPQTGAALFTTCTLDFLGTKSFISAAVAAQLGLPNKIGAAREIEVEISYDIYAATVVSVVDSQQPAVLGQQAIELLGLKCDTTAGTCVLGPEIMSANPSQNQTMYGDFDGYEGMDPYQDMYTDTYSPFGGAGSGNGAGNQQGCGCDGTGAGAGAVGGGTGAGEAEDGAWDGYWEEGPLGEAGSEAAGSADGENGEAVEEAEL